MLFTPLTLLLTAFARAWESVEPKLDAHFARVQSSFRRDLSNFVDAVDELLGSALDRARTGLAERVLAIRNISLREQLTAMMLCAAIRVAVARSSHRHNPR